MVEPAGGGTPGGKPSLSPVAPLELPPSDPGDDNARILTDGLKFMPVIIDHEGVVSSKHKVDEILGESARAIVIHRIRARCGPRTCVAVLARIESKADTAFPVEGLRTNLGGRPHYGWGRVSNNESGGCISEGAL